MRGALPNHARPGPIRNSGRTQVQTTTTEVVTKRVMRSEATSRSRRRAPGVRFGWGLTGARATADPAGALVIVDVLSFTTSVTIAVDRGTSVYPHRWPDPGVDLFAAAHDAVWAVRRQDVSLDHPWSLSPTQLRKAPAPERLVLPSPNGSTIAASVPAKEVVAGCLRNATAVAEWLVDHDFGGRERPVTFVAAGEHWPNGELRPALEDLLGAGAIIAALDRRRRSPSTLSRQAAAANATWQATRSDLHRVLRACVSGRELTADGYATDVVLAAEHDRQDAVPVLAGGAFRRAGPPWAPGQSGGPSQQS
jgi:2-phosphosulfolactate phosphatase